MNTKEYLSHIAPTVKDLLLSQGYKRESEILQISNMAYEEDYDGYGNDYDLIIIDVQTDKYVTLQKYKSVNEVENIILSAFHVQIPMFKQHYLSLVPIKVGVMDISECSSVISPPKNNRQVI